MLYRKHLTKHHTHTLYRRTNPQCTLLADAVLSATNLSGYSEWIILDHPVAAFSLSANVQAAAPQDTSEHLPWCNPHRPEQLFLSPTVNPSHFSKNKDPFFRIHRYSAILDGCVSCLSLKLQTDNWMQLPSLTVQNLSVHKNHKNKYQIKKKKSSYSLIIVITSEIHPSILQTACPM